MLEKFRAYADYWRIKYLQGRLKYEAELFSFERRARRIIDLAARVKDLSKKAGVKCPSIDKVISETSERLALAEVYYS